jgi:hypothetical protein
MKALETLRSLPDGENTKQVKIGRTKLVFKLAEIILIPEEFLDVPM